MALRITRSPLPKKPEAPAESVWVPWFRDFLAQRAGVDGKDGELLRDDADYQTRLRRISAQFWDQLCTHGLVRAPYATSPVREALGEPATD